MTNILVVDDQACVRELLREELAGEGYRVTAVPGAEDAMVCLKLLRPVLVLLDLYLDGPDDGWEVLNKIKQRYPRLPVIIVTAYDSYVEDPRLSLADGYVVKSFDLTLLKRTVAEVFPWAGAVEKGVSERVRNTSASPLQAAHAS